MAEHDRVLFDRACRLVRTFNYEAHLAQSGLSDLVHRYPRASVPLAIVVFALFWALYWPFYVLLLVLVVLSIPSLAFRSRSVEKNLP